MDSINPLADYCGQNDNMGANDDMGHNDTMTSENIIAPPLVCECNADSDEEEIPPGQHAFAPFIELMTVLQEYERTVSIKRPNFAHICLMVGRLGRWLALFRARAAKTAGRSHRRAQEHPGSPRTPRHTTLFDVHWARTSSCRARVQGFAVHSPVPMPAQAMWLCLCSLTISSPNFWTLRFAIPSPPWGCYEVV